MVMRDSSVNPPARDAFEYFNRPVSERIQEVDTDMYSLQYQDPERFSGKRPTNKWDGMSHTFRFFRLAALVRDLLGDRDDRRLFSRLDAEEILQRCAHSARVEQHGTFSVTGSVSQVAAISFLKDLEAFVRSDEPADYEGQDRLFRTATMAAFCIEAERDQLYRP